MTAIEERLRADLRELARHMVPDQPLGSHGSSPVADPDDGSNARPFDLHDPSIQRRPGRRVLVAFALLVIGVSGIGIWWASGDDVTQTATSAQSPTTTAEFPASGGEAERFGTWAPIPEAPIVSRSHAVAGWTGSEVLLWAGSSLDRSFAYTDGAAYDPLTDTWRTIPVPGWGHPGLVSTFAGSRLYVFAKGGASSFDPSTGVWTDLPPTDGLVASGAVAAVDAVWAVGSVSFGQDARPNLAVARFDEATQHWVRGPVFEGLAGDAPVVDALMSLERDPIWTGSEVVVWGSAGSGLAYDTGKETWRRIPAPVPPSGVLVDSTAVMTSAGLTLIAEIDDSGGPTMSMVTLVGGTWVWSDADDLPIGSIDRVKVASAGDWLVLLRPDGAPIIVNAATGSWSVAVDGPLAGLEGASAVWTGSEMVVWGGVATSIAGIEDPSTGAVWTPPTDVIAAGEDQAAASDMARTGRCEDASHVVATFTARLPQGVSLGVSSMVLSRDPGLESWYFSSARVIGGPFDGSTATWAQPAFDGVHVDAYNTPNLAVPINEAAGSMGFGTNSLRPANYGVDDWFQLDGAIASRDCVSAVQPGG